MAAIQLNIAHTLAHTHRVAGTKSEGELERTGGRAHEVRSQKLLTSEGALQCHIDRVLHTVEPPSLPPQIPCGAVQWAITGMLSKSDHGFIQVME